MTNLLFVYGTLKRGHCRNRVLDDHRFLGEAVTKPKYRMYSVDGAFPALVEDEDGKPIKGEVWEATDALMQTLDMIEGVSAGLYKRAAIQLEEPFDEKEVVGYLFLEDTSDLTDCGVNWQGE